MNDTRQVRQEPAPGDGQRLRPPTMAELVVILRRVPDGPERDQLEGWYWGKAVDRYGPRLAQSYRDEYRFVRAELKRLRLERVRRSPALGAFLGALSAISRRCAA